MEETLYQKNQKQKFDLIVGLIVTLFLSTMLFVEYGNINKIVFLLLFVGGTLGLIQIFSVSIDKASERGFLWGHYLLMSIQLVMMYFSGFDYIFELFAITNSVLLTKNLIGMYLKRNSKEYF